MTGNHPNDIPDRSSLAFGCACGRQVTEESNDEKSVNAVDVEINARILSIVSADLKGSQFSRCRGEPESLPVVAEHTNAAAAVRRQAVTIASFFPAE
jgi:hypothetical protein